MKVCCPECKTSYRIPDDKIKRDVCKATCKKCGARIVIKRESVADESWLQDTASSLIGEETGFVAHDEKTVIDRVPELEDYEATPVLGSPMFPASTEARASASPYSTAVPGLSMRGAVGEPRWELPAASKDAVGESSTGEGAVLSQSNNMDEQPIKAMPVDQKVGLQAPLENEGQTELPAAPVKDLQKDTGSASVIKGDGTSSQCGTFASGAGEGSDIARLTGTIVGRGTRKSLTTNNRSNSVRPLRVPVLRNSPPPIFEKRAVQKAIVPNMALRRSLGALIFVFFVIFFVNVI